VGGNSNKIGNEVLKQYEGLTWQYKNR
jgi:hypothetical protein